LQKLLLDESLADQRDAVLTATNDAGLMTRPVWTLMHRMPMYSNTPKAALLVDESLERRLINIPSSSGLVPVKS
jgi:dTDP-4-amino-4,6-dideoxygalactose transaminase